MTGELGGSAPLFADLRQEVTGELGGGASFFADVAKESSGETEKARPANAISRKSRAGPTKLRPHIMSRGRERRVASEGAGGALLALRLSCYVETG